MTPIVSPSVGLETLFGNINWITDFIVREQR